MTIEQMIMFSKVSLGICIIMVILAAVLFWTLDVKTAWRILNGKNIPLSAAKKKTKNDKNKTDRLKQEIKRTDYLDKGQDVTTVLERAPRTKLLTVGQADDSMMLDITFIHTDIII